MHKQFIIISLLAAAVLLPANTRAEIKSIDNITLSEAQNLLNKKEYSIDYPEPKWLLKELEEDVIKVLARADKKVSRKSINISTIFIYEGTKSSKHIGFGERMSVIKSFYYAFDKFPETELDWQDIIKISAGRWPTQRNIDKENEMKNVFEKIYKRKADMSQQNDNAMITVATYGLRPQKIDYTKENISFKYYNNCLKNNNIFSIEWEYHKMWDIIRGIAYSGATR